MIKREKEMKYLSFDIECCDGRHICEFGYVVVDEKFNVLERDCITMNPEYKFALTGREHEKDILLSYPEEIYYNSPTFDYYYTKIKDLLTMPDCKIIGFSLYNDSVFLATACELYDREPIKFEYYDFQKLYQGYMKSRKSASVESMTKELGITDIKLHKSDDDAWAVIRGLQVIGEKEKISLVDTVNLLKKCNNDYHAEQAIERNRTLVEKAKSGNISAQNKIMKRFIHKLKIKNLNKNDDFTGKNICISSNFQKAHFNEFLGIIQRLYEYGANYTGKASECDVFIEYQKSGIEDPRYLSVMRAIETENRYIRILSLDEGLKALNLVLENLSKIDHVNGKAYIEKNKQRKEKGRIHNFIDKTNIPTTIGDILKSKGVNF